jgi:6-phosphogluconolactonase
MIFGDKVVATQVRSYMFLGLCSFQSQRRMTMKIKTIIALTTIVLVLWAGASLAAGRISPGAVYTMTNDAAGNKVVIFSRDHEGLLTKAGSISTGGTGSGVGLDPLGSQGSLVLSNDHRWLLAVNAGSHEISVFRVLPDGLDLVDKVDSGGKLPVSLTIFHNLVYVLNAGASPNITGFNLSHKGHLTALADSGRSLSGGFEDFAQVGFDPEGETLVVTDKKLDEILVFSVGEDGLPALNPVTTISNGHVPFGFIFDNRGHLLVVEAGTNAVSSYNISDDGDLDVISQSVLNFQKAACWIVGNERGYIFTANPGTSSISAYGLDAENGELALLNGTAAPGLVLGTNTPLDLAISVDGRFLYALDPNNETIDMFQIEHDGTLTNLGTVPGGLSIFAQGIAAL